MRTYLSPQVIEKIMPFYQRLASDTTLERCVAGKTQNSNECLHSCICRKCPKEVFVSKRRLEIAVTDAIEKHNLGYLKSFEAKEDSCLNDSFSLTIAERQDKRRISQNISTKQKKRKRNATNTNAAYSAEESQEKSSELNKLMVNTEKELQQKESEIKSLKSMVKAKEYQFDDFNQMIDASLKELDWTNIRSAFEANEIRGKLRPPSTPWRG
ncbi:uncharacterized protein TNCV_3647291 [Trichonephila clavipes]|nr:uncharacterized protein TNCV_3647291 [Trichonephila clavipes]